MELEDALKLLKDREDTISLIHSLENAIAAAEENLNDTEKQLDESMESGKRLTRQIEILTEQNKKLKSQITTSKAQIETLKKQNETLTKQNIFLIEQSDFWKLHSEMQE